MTNPSTIPTGGLRAGGAGVTGVATSKGGNRGDKTGSVLPPVIHYNRPGAPGTSAAQNGYSAHAPRDSGTGSGRGSRSSRQAADRLFTGSSQRRLHTMNLQEDIKMERYATTIERAMKSTEHDHAFQRKTLTHRSEQLAGAQESFKKRSMREQEAALQAERNAQLNRERLNAIMDRITAVQNDEDKEPEVAPHNATAPPAGATGTKLATGTDASVTEKDHRTLVHRKTSSDSINDMIFQRLRRLSTTQEASWNWDYNDVDVISDTLSRMSSGRQRKISEPAPRKISAESLSSPRRKISEGSGSSQPLRMRKISTGSESGALSRKSSMTSETQVRRTSGSARRPAPLSRRVSAASFASSALSTASGSRAEGKRSRSTGDAPDPATLNGGIPSLSRRTSQHSISLSRRGSQQQLDMGDLKRLTRRLNTNTGTDTVTDPELMVDEERKVYDFLQRTQAASQPDSGQSTPFDSNNASLLFQRAPKQRKSVVYTESAQRQLSQIFGNEVIEEIQHELESSHLKDKHKGSSDAMLQRLAQTPRSLPPVYTMRTRALQPRDFAAEAKARKTVDDVNDQFENLRYCRYLRLPSSWENEGEALDGTSGEINSGTGGARVTETKKRTPRAAPKTVDAVPVKRMSFFDTASYIKSAVEVNEAVGKKEQDILE